MRAVMLQLLFILICVFGALSQNFPDKQCKFDNTVYDVVVVGTGPASGPVIRRLSDAGYTIAVVEKGPFFKEGKTSKPKSKAATAAFLADFQVLEDVYWYPSYNYSANGLDGTCIPKTLLKEFDIEPAEVNITRNLRRYRAYPYVQVQGYGGQTLTYGGLHIRPSPAAFDSWPLRFSYSEMLPWYEKFEKSSFACNISVTNGEPYPSEAHNCGNFTGFIPVDVQNPYEYPPVIGFMPKFCASGYTKGSWENTYPYGSAVDYNGNYTNRAFCGPPQFAGEVIKYPNNTDKDVYRANLQETYLTVDYINSHPNIQVCVNSTARRLILDEDNNVVAVQIAGTEKLIYGKRFVIASGVLHTPSLLMSSGIGPKAALNILGLEPKIDLPGVGTHFHDEWAYALTFEVTKNADYWLGKPSVRNRNQLPIVKFMSKAHTNFTDVQLYLRLDNQLALDLYLPQNYQGGFERSANGIGIRVASFQNDTFGASSGVFPTSSNGVYADRFQMKIDMFSNDKLMYRYLESAWSGFCAATQMISKMKRQVDQNGVPLQLTPSTMTKAIMKAAARSVQDFEYVLAGEAMVLALHGGGTAGMNRVVDEYFKVFHTPNLYICDMSIFPSPVDANPTATLFALGERLAQQLIEEGNPVSYPTASPSPSPFVTPSRSPHVQPEISKDNYVIKSYTFGTCYSRNTTSCSTFSPYLYNYGSNITTQMRVLNDTHFSVTQIQGCSGYFIVPRVLGAQTSLYNYNRYVSGMIVINSFINGTITICKEGECCYGNPCTITYGANAGLNISFDSYTVYYSDNNDPWNFASFGRIVENTTYSWTSYDAFNQNLREPFIIEATGCFSL